MPELQKTGIVTKTTGSWHSVNTGEFVYKCKIRGKLRIENYKSTNPIAVGDVVNFELTKDDTGIIKTVRNRKNGLVRQSTNLSKQSHLIACNIDQAILIISLSNPETPIEFVDRFLLSCQVHQVQTILVFNKIDVYDNEQVDKMEKLIAMYEEIGHLCVRVSALKHQNIVALEQLLKDKTSVIAGNSGVGKSSLINILDTKLKLKVADISRKYKTGKHTTTYAQMYEMPFGGYVIDTPGIKAFGVSFIETELIAQNFPEIFEQLKNCKYHNCKHIDEPDCAVKKAVATGKIAISRYKSYLSIMLNENNKHR